MVPSFSTTLALTSNSEILFSLHELLFTSAAPTVPGSPVKYSKPLIPCFYHLLGEVYYSHTGFTEEFPIFYMEILALCSRDHNRDITFVQNVKVGSVPY